MTCDECKSLGIPDHLCTEGKEINVLPFDDPNELIYRRFCNLTGSFIPETLTPIEIEKLFTFRSDSCNRSSLCNAGDTLIDKDGNTFYNWGIWSIEVSKFNEFNVTSQDKETKCSFRPVHVPEPCNYAHVELEFFVDGSLVKQNKPRWAKQVFRKKLLEKLQIIKQFEPVDELDIP